MSKRIADKNLKLKRAYDPPAASDGTRILIDRLWPRGVSKATAALDQWDKNIAPSTMLRNWFRHDPARWQEFRRRYADEIHKHREQLDELRARAQSGRITLVFAAHDKTHNHAIVLRDILLGRTAMRNPHSTTT
jgi:uncharacterized protein YeaO (DUF488 family)